MENEADANEADDTHIGELIDLTSIGLAERRIEEGTRVGYLGMIRTLTYLMVNQLQLFPTDPFRKNEAGEYLSHSSINLRQWVLPMEVNNAKTLFTLLSLDESIPRCAVPAKKRKRVQETGKQLAVNILQLKRSLESNNVATCIQLTNLGSSLETVSSGAMGNYKSAFKWWHTHSCAEWKKEPAEWSYTVGTQLAVYMASYKRDMVKKKRAGIVPCKEGKDAFSFSGYECICVHMMAMKAKGK
jgi:hypothetical protein